MDESLAAAPPEADAMQPDASIAQPVATAESRQGIAERILGFRPQGYQYAVFAIWFFLSFAYYGVFIWLPSILAKLGYSSIEQYTFFFLSAVFQFPGYFAAAYLVEKVGRKPLLAVYLAACAALTLLYSFAHDNVSILISLFALSFFCLGGWGALYAYTPELFPTSARSFGVGISSASGRIAGMLAPSIAGILMASVSLGAVWIVMAAAFAAAGVSVIFGIETRGRQLA